MPDNGGPIIERLDAIIERLDLVLFSNIPPVDMSADLGAVERAVLELCDMQHTSEEIGTRIDKKKHHVDVTLSNLRKKGLARSIRSGGRVVHLRCKMRGEPNVQ
jgi:hypothetical protein